MPLFTAIVIILFPKNILDMCVPTTNPYVHTVSIISEQDEKTHHFWTECSAIKQFTDIHEFRRLRPSNKMCFYTIIGGKIVI